MIATQTIEFRCSSLGDFMTGLTGLTEIQKEKLNEYHSRFNGNGRPLTDNQIIEFGKLIEKANNREISESAKNVVLERYLFYTYGYKEIVNNEQMIKGSVLESEAIKLVSEYEGVFYKKNKVRKANGYITGELDVLTPTHIKDIKVSKNIRTFHEVEKESKQYYWQGQGYMWLWEIPKFELTYVLIPDPDDHIERQLSRASYLLVGEDYDKFEKQTIHNNKIIESIPLEKRIKTFKFDFDPGIVEQIKIQYEKAIEYYDKLIS